MVISGVVQTGGVVVLTPDTGDQVWHHMATWHHATHHLTLAQDEHRQTGCSVILIIANIVNPVSHNMLECI